MRSKALLTLIAVVAIGCSGSSKPVDEPGTSSIAAPAEGQAGDSAEDTLRRAQLGACGPMCERLTECAVEDARANMTEAELAELDLENTAPRNTSECETDCRARSLSPRQVVVVRECVNGPAECDEYLTCLQGASKAD